MLNEGVNIALFGGDIANRLFYIWSERSWFCSAISDFESLTLLLINKKEQMWIYSNGTSSNKLNVISFLIISGGPRITLAKPFSAMHFFKGALPISLAIILFCNFLVDYKK